MVPSASEEALPFSEELLIGKVMTISAPALATGA
jgi:hypothetical protein